MTKDTLSRYTLRIGQELLDKFRFVAAYEGRSANKELEQMIKQRISEFESLHGTIEQK